MAKLQSPQQKGWRSYVSDEARRFYGLVDTGKVNSAKILARGIAKRRLHHRFTIRDVPKQGWTGIQSTSDAETALAFWEESHSVQRIEVATEIGRPSMRFNSGPKARGWR
ncbi:hypothetical protein [Comamonas aquatica]|uniref:hypothetical protein n=1 Tax=Comamonas aquatica TaxID=225991 RepID=UPI0021B13D48|nr:hypothetical protein [Comamonas aquatica]